MDFPELVRSAESIVHARVIRHWSAWDDAHRFIWTHYEIQVQERLKGSAVSRVISEPGGVVNDMAMKVAGVPEHADGEEMVVFLHRTPIGYWRCYGLGQGKFTVARSAGGERRVKADLLSVDRARATTRARTLGPPLERMNGITLAEFKQRIRGEAARQ